MPVNKDITKSILSVMENLYRENVIPQYFPGDYNTQTSYADMNKDLWGKLYNKQGINAIGKATTSYTDLINYINNPERMSVKNRNIAAKDLKSIEDTLQHLPKHNGKVERNTAGDYARRKYVSRMLDYLKEGDIVDNTRPTAWRMGGYNGTVQGPVSSRFSVDQSRNSVPVDFISNHPPEMESIYPSGQKFVVKSVVGPKLTGNMPTAHSFGRTVNLEEAPSNIESRLRSMSGARRPNVFRNLLGSFAGAAVPVLPEMLGYYLSSPEERARMESGARDELLGGQIA